MASEPGWSAEMDRKIEELRADPDGYWHRAYGRHRSGLLSAVAARLGYDIDALRQESALEDESVIAKPASGPVSHP